MAIRKIKPTTPSRRHMSTLINPFLSKQSPHRALIKTTLKRKSGRNNTGKITIHHRGGGSKKRLRIIDFKRNKFDLAGVVRTLEYDPNRTSNIALIVFPDGDQRYILAPEGLKPGDRVVSSASADISIGNTLPLEKIPVGTPIHNLELTPGKGGQIVRSAGSFATIQSKEGQFAAIQLPSKEIRLIRLNCLATIGQVSNSDKQNVKLGKAGRKRHLGIRPTVRGTAKHPGAHPHGGGEGRSGVGMKYPKTPWGKHALGKKTRKLSKFSDKYIIKDRRK